jgi:hypothetical protein
MHLLLGVEGIPFREDPNSQVARKGRAKNLQGFEQADRQI